MADKIIMVDMINVDFFVKRIEKELSIVIKNSTHSEVTNYINMLPKEHDSDEALLEWGLSFLNEYYKVMKKLEDKENTREIDDLKRKIYILYLIDNYNKTVLTFDEFITFSRLINIAFYDYNIEKTRKRDNEQFQSGDGKIDNMVNTIASDVLHSPQPHAYEVTRFKLTPLLKVLKEKEESFINEEFAKIDLDDPLLCEVLSEKRIHELKKKRN